MDPRFLVSSFFKYLYPYSISRLDSREGRCVARKVQERTMTGRMVRLVASTGIVAEGSDKKARRGMSQKRRSCWADGYAPEAD